MAQLSGTRGGDRAKICGDCKRGGNSDAVATVAAVG